MNICAVGEEKRNLGSQKNVYVPQIFTMMTIFQMRIQNS